MGRGGPNIICSHTCYWRQYKSIIYLFVFSPWLPFCQSKMCLESYRHILVLSIHTLCLVMQVLGLFCYYNLKTCITRFQSVFGHHSIFFDKKDRQGKKRSRSTLVLLAIKACAICKVGRRSVVRPSPPTAQKAPTPRAEIWWKSAFFALLRTWVVTTTKNALNENYYF